MVSLVWSVSNSRWLIAGEQGSPIATGSDADSFTEEGKYIRGGGASVTVTNLPTNGDGLLQVIKYSGFRKQIWNDTNSRREFIRLSWGSQAKWSPWLEVTLTIVS